MKAFPIPREIFKLAILDGRYWARFEKDGVVETWAPIGKQYPIGHKDRVELKTVLSWYQLAWFYFKTGILANITGPIITHNDKKVLKTINGCATEKKSPSNAK